MKDNYENIEEVFTEMLKYSVDEAFKYCDEGYDETKNPEFLLYKGHAHLVSGEYEEAILSVDKAFELGCDYQVYGYNVKAEALLELGLYVESRRYYERVIELSPDNYIATIFQVELDIREEFYEDAISRAEAYIENYGNNKDEVADLKSAMANALLPEDNRILYEFAFELLRQEKKEEAIEMFKEILIYNPDDEEVAGLISSLN